jgi:hypothetical protein
MLLQWMCDPVWLDTRYPGKAEGKDTFQRFHLDQRRCGLGVLSISERSCFRWQSVGQDPDTNVTFEIRPMVNIPRRDQTAGAQVGKASVLADREFA